MPPKKSTGRKSSGRKYSKKAGKAVKREMHKMKRGTLKSGQLGQKGQEPEAGNRDRPLRGPARRRQSSEKEILVRRIFLVRSL